MRRSPERTTTRRGRGRGVVVTGYSRTKRVNEPERKAGVRLPSPIPESALYKSLATHLSGLGYTCWRDVSFLGSWIDLLARRDQLKLRQILPKQFAAIKNPPATHVK